MNNLLGADPSYEGEPAPNRTLFTEFVPLFMTPLVYRLVERPSIGEVLAVLVAFDEAPDG